ncbi:hypothetical protein JEZ13_04120 [bacterium]|nr:hypothetical protein [bacterium]
MFYHRRGGSEGTNIFLNSISKFGVIVFFITVIVSLWLLLNHSFFLRHYAIYTSLAIAFVVTFIFELIYNLIRNKPNN